MKGIKMRAIIFIILISASGCNKSDPQKEINSVLDSLHYFASVADQKKYIDLFSKNAVFFGTDIDERWPIDDFNSYVKSRFDTGTGWTYKANSRNIFVAKDKRTAWFDEIVENKSYGEFRGTGVLVLVSNEWKISQYNLLLPIPNDFLQKYANEIKKYYSSN